MWPSRAFVAGCVSRAAASATTALATTVALMRSAASATSSAGAGSSSDSNSDSNSDNSCDGRSNRSSIHNSNGRSNSIHSSHSGNSHSSIHSVTDIDFKAKPRIDSAAQLQQHLLRPNYHAPRNPVVLCHGLFGYDYKGFESMPALQLHYWRGVKATLEKLGATVYVARVASTGNVRQRAEQLHALLSSIAAKSDSTAAATAEADGRPRINLVGHSMGGLDGRYLVSHVRPHEYDVVSLTTVATPHRGSPFMDWCRDVLGLASIPPPDGMYGAAACGGTHAALLADQRASDVASAHSSDSSSVASAGRSERYGNSGGSGGGGHAGAISMASMLFPSLAMLGQPSPSESAALPTSISSASSASSTSSARSSPADTTERIRSYVAAQLTGASRSVVDALTACLQLMADKPAYIFLTTDYCKRVFNPNTPDSPRTRYYSYGAIADPADIGWLTVLKFTQSVVSARAGPNDGVVPHNSSRWGTYVETLPADHFALTGRGPGLADALDGLAAYMSSASSLLTSAELLNVLRKSSASGSSGRTAAFSPLSSSSSSSSSSAASPAASASFNVNDFYARLCTRLYRDGF